MGRVSPCPSRAVKQSCLLYASYVPRRSISRHHTAFPFVFTNKGEVLLDKEILTENIELVKITKEIRNIKQAEDE